MNAKYDIYTYIKIARMVKSKLPHWTIVSWFFPVLPDSDYWFRDFELVPSSWVSSPNGQLYFSGKPVLEGSFAVIAYQEHEGLLTCFNIFKSETLEEVWNICNDNFYNVSRFQVKVAQV